MLIGLFCILLASFPFVPSFKVRGMLQPQLGPRPHWSSRPDSMGWQPGKKQHRPHCQVTRVARHEYRNETKNTPNTNTTAKATKATNTKQLEYPRSSCAMQIDGVCCTSKSLQTNSAYTIKTTVSPKSW